jgi:hypothetical protein
MTDEYEPDEEWMNAALGTPRRDSARKTIEQLKTELDRKQKAIDAIWPLVEDDYDYPNCNTPAYQDALELLDKERNRL